MTLRIRPVNPTTVAEPGEIATLVAFPAGDGASSLTATTVFAGGGAGQSSPGR